MRSDPVFPSLGSTMGGVTHSYMVSEGAGASSGSMGGPLTYVAFQHPGSTGQPNTVQDEIRTIFITGFPDNVNERELHNLCRFIPGYEASQVSIKPNQQPQVFVLFSSAAHARQALEAIAGLPFDVQQPTMHAVGGKPLGPESAGTAATTSSTSMSTALLNTQTGSSEGRLMSPTDTSNASKAVSAPAAAPAGDSASTMGRLQQFVGGSTQSSTGPSPAPQLMQHSSNSSLSNVVVGQGMRPTPDSQTTGLASSPPGGHMFHTVQLLPPVKYNLRCEMAHKNLYVKDGDPSVRRPHRQIVLLNNPLHMHSGMGSSGAVGHLAPAPTAGPTTTMAGASGGSYVHDLNPMYAPSAGAAGVPHTLTVHPLMAAATGPPQSLTVQHSGGVSSMPMGTPLGFLPVTNRGDNPPCNTLFIGNLSDQVSELELLHLLSGQPGYRQMKLVRGPRQVSCFVEFEDTVSATAVHNSYQGAVLASSDRGGIRIQYSKNPFGRSSSNPGSNMAALRSAVSMQGSSDIASTVSNWPVVTYHTMQQPARMGQPMTQPQLQGQHTITYY